MSFFPLNYEWHLTETQPISTQNPTLHSAVSLQGATDRRVCAASRAGFGKPQPTRQTGQLPHACFLNKALLEHSSLTYHLWLLSHNDNRAEQQQKRPNGPQSLKNVLSSPYRQASCPWSGRVSQPVLSTLVQSRQRDAIPGSGTRKSTKTLTISSFPMSKHQK